jgi:ABC-type nitrate/sulfonate/bicarbonate transport system substrate-binding protein
MPSLHFWIAHAANVLFSLATCIVGDAAGAGEPTTLRVKVFIGAQNLPIYAGIAKGFFEKHGVKVDLQFTPNSDAMRKGLAAGEFDIAR